MTYRWFVRLGELELKKTYLIEVKRTPNYGADVYPERGHNLPGYINHLTFSLIKLNVLRQ